MATLCNQIKRTQNVPNHALYQAKLRPELSGIITTICIAAHLGSARSSRAVCDGRVANLKRQWVLDKQTTESDWRGRQSWHARRVRSPTQTISPKFGASRFSMAGTGSLRRVA